ncbi:MAG TPA: hypothetical protein VFP42_06245 [Acidimicrobiia bacterium]|nr:hypothetical protein [Acidimicrobiia bacterium]
MTRDHFARQSPRVVVGGIHEFYPVLALAFGFAVARIAAGMRVQWRP